MQALPFAGKITTRNIPSKGNYLSQKEKTTPEQKPLHSRIVHSSIPICDHAVQVGMNSLHRPKALLISIMIIYIERRLSCPWCSLSARDASWFRVS